ncbi:MAG: GreA/GreB family elongation factor [Cytophagaceae bacterium]
MKNKLIEALEALLNQKIGLLKNELVQVQASANEETKSSAGDKYETGRAMAQLEIERLTKSLADQESLQKQLQKAKNNESGTLVSTGSLVSTSVGIYYIAVSIGIVTIEQNKIMCISAESPIGKLLIGKSVGQSIEWNKQSMTITAIE